MSINFCKEHINTFWVNNTDCIKDIPHTYRQIQEIDNLRKLVGQLTKNEDDPIQSRYKRGVFNFIGGISKILFGTFDNEESNYYSDKINSLEKEQMEFLRLSKEQTDNCHKDYAEVFKFYLVGSFRQRENFV
jgi:hypothetical protein